jgi:TfoX/Sxy family transcriptional regulator of competence genes
MAYDEHLAMRIRDSIGHLENVEEKRMMGGLVFMVDGKMCVGIIKDELMCRIDPDRHAEVVEMNGCRTMDFTHRPMPGYILVEPAALRTAKDLNQWIQLALEFNPRAKASKKG